jgi:hypothetical protein
MSRITSTALFNPAYIFIIDEITVLTGNCVNLSKKGVKLLNFAFNIIDDNANPMSIKRNYFI